MANTIVVFFDAAGIPIDCLIGNAPNREEGESYLHIAQEGIDRLAEREPMLAMLTKTVQVYPIDGDLDVLAYHFNITKREGYLAWRA